MSLLRFRSEELYCHLLRLACHLLVAAGGGDEAAEGEEGTALSSSMTADGADTPPAPGDGRGSIGITRGGVLVPTDGRPPRRVSSSSSVPAAGGGASAPTTPTAPSAPVTAAAFLGGGEATEGRQRLPAGYTAGRPPGLVVFGGAGGGSPRWGGAEGRGASLSADSQSLPLGVPAQFGGLPEVRACMREMSLARGKLDSMLTCNRIEYLGS